MKLSQLPTIAPLHQIVFAIIFASLSLILVASFGASGGDELYLRFVSMFAYWVHASGIAIIACLFFAAVFYNFGKGWKIRHDLVFPAAERLALTGGISPDIAVFSLSPDESPEELAKRWESAMLSALGKYAVCIAFRQPCVLIYGRFGTKEVQEVFTRDTPPTGITAIQQPPFTSESWEQYQGYVADFCAEFPEWSATQKITITDDPARGLLRTLNTMAVTLALLLFSLPMFAQKTVQVSRYLGDIRYFSAPDAGKVKFVFQKAVLVRESDGRKTYAELLKGGANFSDADDAGKLLGIQTVSVSGVPSVIAPDSGNARKVEANAESARPIPETKSGLPDSVTVARDIDEAKTSVEKWKADMWRVVRPYWAFVMYLFSSFFLILLLIGGMAWYVSSTAAGESAMNLHGVPVIGRWLISIHQFGAGTLLIIAWAVVGVLLVNIFLWIVYTGLPTWIMFVLWAIVLGIAKKVTNKIVPNIPVMGGRGNGMVKY